MSDWQLGPSRPTAIFLGGTSLVGLGTAVLLSTDGFSAVAIGAGVLGLAAAAALAVVATSRLELDATGVRAKHLFSRTAITWDEVSHYTFWSVDQVGMLATGRRHPHPIGVLLNGVVAAIRRTIRSPHLRFTRGRMMIVASSGRLNIDRRYEDVAIALERAFEEIHARLRTRTRRRYDPFTLDATKLAHDRNGEVALRDIECVQVADRQLEIYLYGRDDPWTAVASDRLANVALFLEDLSERGVVVAASPGMFLPGPAREAVSRHANLAPARIHQR